MATVLYVDDEAPIRRAVTTWLTRKGHVVHEAETAEAARAIIAAHAGSIHGIFIDRWLGSDSGTDLYEWLRERFPQLADRVAFVTGDLFDSPAVQRDQERPVFAKPFELKALEAQVQEWATQGT